MALHVDYIRMEINLSELIEALSSPEAYPHPTDAIKVVQTQMSCVFLTGNYAYKVKKPVNLGYLDYTTLEKRVFFCRKEIRLNRRLAPRVYLDVVPIVSRNGAILVGDKGEPLEYAVKMTQLPQEKMLDVLLSKGKVTGEMMRRVAEKIASFHNRARTNGRIAAFGRRELMEKNARENFLQTREFIDKALSRESYDCMKSYSENFLKEKTLLFQRRMEDGRIRDCHGDLHSAHICFGRSIYIYDCIEFNDRFRYGDVASEVAFLAMDLDYYGRKDLSRTFVSTYQEFSEDFEVQQLLDFYKVYRAYVRAKVNCFKSQDSLISNVEREESLKTARRYFKLAESYIRAEPRPMLFITTGLVGTGKSALAAALAEKIGGAMLSSDKIRKELAGISIWEHRFEEFGKGIYSEEFTRKTYEALFSKARELLRLGKNVILDASFLRKADRQGARDVATECEVPFIILECRAPEAVIKERLETRMEEQTASDGRWEIFQSQKGYFEAVEEEPEVLHLIVDTSRAMPEIINQILSQIQ